MTGFGGPPDDPSNRPTRMANYSAVDSRPPGSDDDPDYSEPAAPESPPDPWYRNRSLLAVWATMVAILIVLIIYSLIQISHGSGGETPTTKPSTTPTRSSTTTPSTTPSPSTTTSPPPPPSSTPEEPEPSDDYSPPPAEAPPPAEPPRHHHHLPHIPSTITLPHTVITLPPGW